MTRFIQARDERFARANKEFKSQTEKDDFYTLTQTRFAFWAAAGYATFHRRECRKLKGLSNLRGFSRYKDAIRSGHTPCKYCKPNAKQDIVCPIPINNRKRADECVGDLETLCNEHGYPFQFENGMFLFSTPVGKWKINTMQKPYTVEHINLVTRPGNEFYYHRQPRLFLSLLDTFEYIHRHDKDLAAKTSGLIATSVEQACSE